jgi:hypothetical protein
VALLDTLIIAGLVMVWGWVLGKPVLANLAGTLRRDPVGSFNRQLDVLGRAPHRSIALPGVLPPSVRASRRQAARRRQIFLALVISVVTSLALAVVFGGVFTTLHLTMAALLIGYLALAYAAGRHNQHRSATVVRLRPAPEAAVAPHYARVSGDR